MRLTTKTASGWLIRLALTAALLHWEYAAANGTNIFFYLKKQKHIQISFSQRVFIHAHYDALICRFLFFLGGYVCMFLFVINDPETVIDRLRHVSVCVRLVETRSIAAGCSVLP